MKIVGLTGGIGSGKSTVAKMLESKGLPVYYADIRAKALMHESENIINTLKANYGDHIYVDGKLNRPLLAEKVFNNPDKLQELNALVHPEVFKDFECWKSQQQDDFIVKEAAILFESGSYKSCDVIVTVSAPEEMRIQRTMLRDKITRDQIVARMTKQWTDDQKEAKADYIIKNDQGLVELERAVEQFYYWLHHNQ